MLGQPSLSMLSSLEEGISVTSNQIFKYGNGCEVLVVAGVSWWCGRMHGCIEETLISAELWSPETS